MDMSLFLSVKKWKGTFSLYDLVWIKRNRLGDVCSEFSSSMR